MSGNSDQVETPSSVFKPIPVAVEEVCQEASSKYSGMEPIGNILNTAKRVLAEVFMTRWANSSGYGDGELLEKIATVLAFKALVEPKNGCPTLPISNEDREKLVNMVDATLGLRPNGEKALPFDLPRDVVMKGAEALVSVNKLRELLTRVLLLNAYEPIDTITLLSWVSEGRVFASQDSKSHKYFVTIKVPNKFTGKSEEVLIELKQSVVMKVLTKREKYDTKKKNKGKSKEPNPFEGVPRVLAGYLTDFLTRGWLPKFKSIEFVETVIRLVTEEDTIYNTPEEEMKAVLTRAFSTFGYVKVTRDPQEKDKRHLEVKILADLNSLVYVDEDAKEILVPLKLYRTIEVKTTTKSAFTKRLVSLGVLKTAHTTNSFWFGAKSHTTLHIAIFDLEKLKEFLDMDPTDLMSPNIPKINFQTIEEITRGDTDVQTVQEG
jgi:hypothetical protein